MGCPVVGLLPPPHSPLQLSSRADPSPATGHAWNAASPRPLRNSYYLVQANRSGWAMPRTHHSSCFLGAGGGPVRAPGHRPGAEERRVVRGGPSTRAAVGASVASRPGDHRAGPQRLTWLGSVLQCRGPRGREATPRSPVPPTALCPSPAVLASAHPVLRRGMRWPPPPGCEKSGFSNACLRLPAGRGAPPSSALQGPPHPRAQWMAPEPTCSGSRWLSRLCSDNECWTHGGPQGHCAGQPRAMLLCCPFSATVLWDVLVLSALVRRTFLAVNTDGMASGVQWLRSYFLLVISSAPQT